MSYIKNLRDYDSELFNIKHFPVEMENLYELRESYINDFGELPSYDEILGFVDDNEEVIDNLFHLQFKALVTNDEPITPEIIEHIRDNWNLSEDKVHQLIANAVQLNDIYEVEGAEDGGLVMSGIRYSTDVFENERINAVVNEYKESEEYEQLASYYEKLISKGNETLVLETLERDLGLVYLRHLSDPKSALEHFDNALEIAEDYAVDNFIFSIKAFKMECYGMLIEKGDDPNAKDQGIKFMISAFEEAMQNEELDDPVKLRICYCLALGLDSAEMYEELIEYGLAAIQYIKNYNLEDDEPEEYASIEGYVGHAYHKYRKDPGKCSRPAINHLKKAIEYEDEFMPNDKSMSLFLYDLAQEFELSGNYDEALKVYCTLNKHYLFGYIANSAIAENQEHFGDERDLEYIYKKAAEIGSLTVNCAKKCNDKKYLLSFLTDNKSWFDDIGENYYNTLLKAAQEIADGQFDDKKYNSPEIDAKPTKQNSVEPEVPQFNQSTTYYEALGLDNLCTDQIAIRNAYTRINDTFKSDSPRTKEYLKLVNEAYSCLSDPQKKQYYDTKLRHDENNNTVKTTKTPNTYVPSEKGITTQSNNPYQQNNVRQTPSYNTYSESAPIIKRPLDEQIKLSKRWLAVLVILIVVSLAMCSPGTGSSSSSSSGSTTNTHTTANPDVGLKRISVSNGEILKMPSGECVAPLTINSKSDALNYYIFLDNINDPSNDMGFYVRGGSTVDVDVPLGKYELYYCTGYTWFGLYHKFGSGTSYSKVDKILNFYVDGNQFVGHTITLDVYEGNLNIDSVNESQFPG